MPFTWKRPPGALGGVAPAAAAAPPAAVAPAGATPPEPAAPSPDREDAGRLLVRLYHYLAQHAMARPELGSAINQLGDAVAQYRSAQPGDPYGGVRAVVADIQAVRAGDPSLPEP
jgi:hypothetical protein